MRRDIRGLYSHKISTNKNPTRQSCLMGEDSWCKYNTGKIIKQGYNRKHPLSESCYETKCIKPISGICLSNSVIGNSEL